MSRLFFPPNQMPQKEASKALPVGRGSGRPNRALLSDRHAGHGCGMLQANSQGPPAIAPLQHQMQAMLENSGHHSRKWEDRPGLSNVTN
eukprot:1158705-Pelagomonas_calceolata.AAC.29